MEEKIKKFLEEECNKYKDITDEMIENPQLPSYNNAILDDYYNFMHPIGNELNQLDIEIVKKLENYAINLHRNFKSDFLGDVFWRDFWFIYEFCSAGDNISICNFFGKIFIAVIFIFEKIFRFCIAICQTEIHRTFY